jgi:DNA invertase Pin-like site-specific DNA recombinase
MSEPLATNGRRIGARTDNGRPKLTPEQKARLKVMFDAGVSAPVIAKEFGVSKSRVWQIGRGYRTGHHVAERAQRRSIAGHVHRWTTEGDLTWCELCGAEANR